MMRFPNLEISEAQLSENLDRLAAFSEPTRTAHAVTRRVFSPEHRAAREFLCSLLEVEGIAHRQNSAGVLIARLEPPGCDPQLPPIATGSHIDAIPESGRHDGTVGVLGGIAALAAIQQAQIETRRPIELFDFAEEPTVFGVGCLQSRVMSGFLGPRDADRLVAEDGETTFAKARQRVAGDLAAGNETLEDTVLTPGSYAGWIELHIEQGPRLEAAGKQIGIVTNLSASSTVRVTFHGQGGHAGALLMADRQSEALPAAAAFANACRQAALDAASPAAVATVGMFSPFPGISNSIPSSVELTVDLRDRETSDRDALLEQLRVEAKRQAQRYGASVSFDILNQDPAAISDSGVLKAIAAAADHLGLSTMQLPSFAYHDTTFMSLVCPTGMVFVPSRGGHSHCPEEYTSPEAIGQGVRVLALTLVLLAS